jgi:hypothetical protein
MNYPVNCKKCNQPLYGPVKYCPFCGVASISLADIPAEKKPDIVKAETNTSLMQGEHPPDVRGDISQEGKKIGSSDEDKKVIDKAPQQPEPEISHEEVLTEQGKSSVLQKVGVDKSSITLAGNSGGSGYNDGGTNDGRKHKENLVKVIALAAGIILIIVGFFYYNNDNNDKMKQIQKDVTQKEEKIREETRKAEEASREAEMNRQKAEIERQKAEAAQAEAAREIATKEAASREAAARASAMKEYDRQALFQYLQEGKRYFDMGKYELSIEKMKEVLKRDKNNNEANRYVQMAQERLEKAKSQFRNLTFGGQE